MSLLYFILLIGILIFVHELGHFLFAKWMGVRVLTFSIGFGPKIWGFEHNGTSYQLSVFPLGGYVKMLGEDPTQDVPPEDQKDSLASKAVWQRFLIVFAGPLFNLLLPFPIFFFFGLSQSSVLPPVVGTVTKDGPAWVAGIRPGDKVVRLGSKSIDAWWQMQQHVSDNPGKTMQVVIERDGKRIELKPVTPKLEYDWISQELDIKREVGRLNVTPYFLKPIVAVVENSPASRAGLKTFDQVLTIDGTTIKTELEFVKRLEAARKPVRLTLLREVRSEGAVFEWVRREVKTITLIPQSEAQQLTAAGADVALAATIRKRFAGGWLRGQGIRSAEMFVRFVVPGSAAYKAGLRAGDEVLDLDGQEYPRWALFRYRVFQKPHDNHRVTIRRGEQRLTLELKLDARSEKGELGSAQTVYRFGAHNRSEYVQVDLVPNQHRLTFAFRTSWRETMQATSMTVLALLRLFQGRISSKEIGGPILIYDIAGKTSERGWGYFFQVMVYISINLALINLLPIPLLDGGHIFFLLVEAVRRKPVSLRFREIAAYVGFSILIFLMVFAFKNDIERKWDDIINFFR